jgi:ferredoxin-type protein NapF
VRSSKEMQISAMPSRRRFLMLGDPAPAAGLARRARVSASCLAARGTFCRSCAEHCEPRAIRFELLPAGRSLPHIDDALCNACGECVRVCPAQAMALRVVEARAA